MTHWLNGTLTDAARLITIVAVSFGLRCFLFIEGMLRQQDLVHGLCLSARKTFH
jgi:hypothetical protein